MFFLLITVILSAKISFREPPFDSSREGDLKKRSLFSFFKKK